MDLVIFLNKYFTSCNFSSNLLLNRLSQCLLIYGFSSLSLLSIKLSAREFRLALENTHAYNI